MAREKYKMMISGIGDISGRYYGIVLEQVIRSGFEPINLEYKNVIEGFINLDIDKLALQAPDIIVHFAWSSAFRTERISNRVRGLIQKQLQNGVTPTRICFVHLSEVTNHAAEGHNAKTSPSGSYGNEKSFTLEFRTPSDLRSSIERIFSNLRVWLDNPIGNQHDLFDGHHVPVAPPIGPASEFAQTSSGFDLVD